MLRKVSWTVLGIAGLSLLLCAGCTAEAQSGATGTPQGDAEVATPWRQASGQAPPAGETEALRSSVTQLRAEVSQLRQEVTRLRAQVAETGTGDTRSGTGGAGRAGDTGAQAGSTSPAQGTGGAGTAGSGTGGSGTAQGTGAQAPGVSDVPRAGSTVPAPQGTAVVNAVYVGQVRSASARQVVIDTGTGAPLTLGVGPDTRVLRDGRNIGARQLEKGEQVRAVVDMVGQDQTLEIAVLPAATPGQ